MLYLDFLRSKLLSSPSLRHLGMVHLCLTFSSILAQMKYIHRLTWFNTPTTTVLQQLWLRSIQSSSVAFHRGKPVRRCRDLHWSRPIQDRSLILVFMLIWLWCLPHQLSRAWCRPNHRHHLVCQRRIGFQRWVIFQLLPLALYSMSRTTADSNHHNLTTITFHLNRCSMLRFGVSLFSSIKILIQVKCIWNPHV